MSKGYKAPRSLRLAGMGAAAIVGMAGQASAQTVDPAASDEFLLAAATTVDELTVEAQRKNEHPYADPEAPYKTDRSASTKLTEELLDVSSTSWPVKVELLIEEEGLNSTRIQMNGSIWSWGPIPKRALRSDLASLREMIKAVAEGGGLGRAL